MRIYGRERLAHLWLANPITETLERYRREHDRWMVEGVHHGGEVIRVEPFAAIDIDLRFLWDRGDDERRFHRDRS